MNDNDSIEFFFGEVTNMNYDDEESYFKDDNGLRYFYKIVVEDDMFYIHDTCARMIPVDREFAVGMHNAMFGVKEIYAADIAATELFDARYNKTMQLVDFFNKNQTQ